MSANLPPPSDEPRGDDSRLWTVPFQRNPFFTGREDVLAQLHDALHKSGRAAIVQADPGLCGVGKTEVALEYAYRHRDDYKAVFWVRADTAAEIHTGMLRLANQVISASAMSPEQSVDISQRWLNDQNGWLIIFDDADHLKILKPFLPKKGRGRILVTSRTPNLAGLPIRRSFELTALSPEDATAFLLRRLGRDTTPEERRAAAELAVELGGLPLALEQAAAHLEALPTGFAAYLQDYRRCRDERRRTAKTNGESAAAESVATTWEMSWHEVEASSPVSADLLRASTFLADDAVPLEIFTLGASKLGPALAEALGDDKGDAALPEVVEPLLRFSLMHRVLAPQTVAVHRLGQAVLRAELGESGARQWAERVAAALGVLFPVEPEPENWPWCKRLYPHVRETARLAESLSLDSPGAAQALTAAAWYASDQGWQTEAEAFAKLSLAIREKIFGEDSTDVAASLNNLAAVRGRQGRYTEAEPLYRRSLAIREKVLGPEHRDVAMSYDNLGSACLKQGRNTEAEPLFRRALEMRQKILGSSHHDLILSFGNLGTLAENRNRPKEAERFYQQTLAVTQTVYGQVDPHVAGKYNDLGHFYDRQGRTEEAAECLTQGLVLREQIFGPGHSLVARSLNNLAKIYEDLGRFPEAIAAFKRSHDILKEAFGPHHPDVAVSLENLALFYKNRGRMAKAKDLLQRAVLIFTKSHGAEHPDTVACRRFYQSLKIPVRRPGRR